MRFFKKKINKQEEQPKMPKFEEILASLGELSDDEKKQIHEKTAVDTTEQIDKAKSDIAKNGKDSQTDKDRVDESVGMQERYDGNENTQNAKDRVDEAEGEDKYLKHEEKLAKLESELGALKELVTKAVSNPREVDESTSNKLDDLRRMYLN